MHRQGSCVHVCLCGCMCFCASASVFMCLCMSCEVSTAPPPSLSPSLGLLSLLSFPPFRPPLLIRKDVKISEANDNRVWTKTVAQCSCNLLEEGWALRIWLFFCFSPAQGMDDYISKPVDQYRLQEVLDNWREKETESTIISRERPDISTGVSAINKRSHEETKASFSRFTQ